MSEPKPVNEKAPVAAEIRGGDRAADWQPDEPVIGIGESGAEYEFGGEDDGEDSAGE